MVFVGQTPVVQDVYRASSCFSPRHLSDLLFFNPRHSALFFSYFCSYLPSCHFPSFLFPHLPLCVLSPPPSQRPLLFICPILFTFSSLPHLFLSSPLPIFLPSTDAPPYGRWANGLAGPLRPVGCAVWLSPGALHLAGSTSSHCRHLWVTYSPVPKKTPAYVEGHKWATSMYDNNNVLARPRCIYKVWRLNLNDLQVICECAWVPFSKCYVNAS